jgi:hypothetical protein
MLSHFLPHKSGFAPGRIDHFLVIGLFEAGPVTVQFEERPYVNQELLTGDGWQGVQAGQKLRVTYVGIKHEGAPRYHLFPHSMIYVVSI